MKRTTFGKADLPGQFNLEKYDVCSTWGVAQWWQALTYRSLAQTFVALSPEDCIKEGIDRVELSELWGAAITDVFDEPLSGLAINNWCVPSTSSPGAIRELTGSDLFRAGLLHGESYEGEIKAGRTEGDYGRLPVWQIHRNAGLPGGDQFHIKVELGASDEQIVADFKQWLKRTRKEAEIPPIPKRLSISNFSAWHEKRLLPCLDLMMWAQVQGGSFTLPVLGNALFPDEAERGVESMIRRTTIPQARALTNWHLLNTLFLQLREET